MERSPGSERLDNLGGGVGRGKISDQQKTWYL